jgi:GMP synthase-like glutamine amidotransferase
LPTPPSRSIPSAFPPASRCRISKDWKRSTGSSAGVYDAFDWIAPLEGFVRIAHDKKVPMVGVCFGHQLIAQALGGTVRKSEKGWGLGRHVYDVAPGNGLVEGAHIALACSHQDQVITPPAGTKTILYSDFTPYAGLLYEGGTTLSVQAHPEFTIGFALACCDMVRSKGEAPDSVVTSAQASLAEPRRAHGSAARSRAFSPAHLRAGRQ